MEDTCLAENDINLRKRIIHTAKTMHRRGFAPGTSGNLSLRVNDTEILVTPTGRSKGSLRCEDLVVVDMDGRHIAGRHSPTTEIGMHLAIYRRRVDVTAVVHAHPPTATGLAVAGIALDEPLCAEQVMMLGIVPLAPYATTGSPELEKALAPFIGDHDAILMANHGVVTYSSSLDRAFMLMEMVEHCAKIRFVVQQMGCHQVLNAEQIESLVVARENYGRQTMKTIV